MRSLTALTRVALFALCALVSVGGAGESAKGSAAEAARSVSSSSSRLTADRVIRQIEIARRHNTGGFVLFNYGQNESRELLPLLGAGATRKAEK